MGIFLHLLLACLLFPAITGLQWASNDRDTFCCTGQTVTLPLDFSPEAGDEIIAVSWFFGGSTEQKMIATSLSGHFSALLTFSHRVQQVGMGGLKISHVTLEDAGSYTVEVNGTDDLSMLRNVTLHVADMVTPRVAFNAKSPGTQLRSPPAHVQFPIVLYNQGGGFNSATGDFTAPVSGIYVLYFHVMSDHSHFANSFLKVRGTVVCTANCNPNYNHASCQAAVHMTAGHRAWVEPAGNNRYYWLQTTSFTGFLLSHDNN